MLCGFSWEHTYHMAVEMYAVSLEDPTPQKLTMYCVVLVFTFPAVVFIIFPARPLHSANDFTSRGVFT